MKISYVHQRNALGATIHVARIVLSGCLGGDKLYIYIYIGKA